MCSACFSTKMLVAKLAQMGNFCLAKSDVTWPLAQMATGSTSLAISFIIIIYQTKSVQLANSIISHWTSGTGM